jgi:hypothetical protein
MAIVERIELNMPRCLRFLVSCLGGQPVSNSPGLETFKAPQIWKRGIALPGLGFLI